MEIAIAMTMVLVAAIAKGTSTMALALVVLLLLMEWRTRIACSLLLLLVLLPNELHLVFRISLLLVVLRRGRQDPAGQTWPHPGCSSPMAAFGHHTRVEY